MPSTRCSRLLQPRLQTAGLDVNSPEPKRRSIPPAPTSPGPQQSCHPDRSDPAFSCTRFFACRVAQ